MNIDHWPAGVTLSAVGGTTLKGTASSAGSSGSTGASPSGWTRSKLSGNSDGTSSSGSGASASPAFISKKSRGSQGRITELQMGPHKFGIHDNNI
ncbi:UNVERIFIED_CONTAM: hypothetical protein Sradi_3983900 [Sesamum radiatum]|uniref:Uncharacterized protein n=1 Tax=Sesamum radiatum TaxID=300843 RepID=A0AAW2PGW5_SESRA